MKKRAAVLRACLRMFPRQACKFTVRDVIWWMDALGCSQNTIRVPCVSSRILRVWELESSNIVLCPAQDIPALWYGGPRIIKKYQGHLMQLLMDRVLSEVLVNGISFFININKRFRSKKKDEALKALRTQTNTFNLGVDNTWVENCLPSVAGTAGWGGSGPFELYEAHF